MWSTDVLTGGGKRHTYIKVSTRLVDELNLRESKGEIAESSEPTCFDLSFVHLIANYDSPFCLT